MSSPRFAHHLIAHLMALALISSHIFLYGAGELFEDCNNQTCLMETPNPSAGSQLLQLSRLNAQLKASVECSGVKLGKVSPLNDIGFRDVAESCCFDDMKEFIRRVAKQKKLKVCHEGGLSGFAPFFSCSNETTLLDMTSEILSQAEGKAPCRWLGLADQECVPMEPSCGVNMNPLHQESVLAGYMGLEAENNPPALVTNTAIRDRLIKDIAAKLGVPESAVKIEIGTGPVGSASLYQVAMKSPKTGKYVEIGPDGDLVASSTSFKTFNVRHQRGESFLVSGGSKEFLVTWNKDDLSFQSEAGEDAVEDDRGRVVFGKNPDRRLQIDFPGFRSLATASLGKHSTSLVAVDRSCTVIVSFLVLQTDPPSLDKEHVKDTADKMDVPDLQSTLTHDLDAIESCLGKLEISTFKYCKEKGSCENKSLRLAHSDREYNHEGNHVPGDDKE